MDVREAFGASTGGVRAKFGGRLEKVQRKFRESSEKVWGEFRGSLEKAKTFPPRYIILTNLFLTAIFQADA